MPTILSLPYLKLSDNGEGGPDEKARLINMLEITNVTPIRSGYTEQTGLTLSFSIIHRGRGDDINIRETLPATDVAYLARWYNRLRDGRNKVYSAMFRPGIFLRPSAARRLSRQSQRLWELESDLVARLDLDHLRTAEPAASAAYIRLRDHRNSLLLEVRNGLKDVPADILYHPDVGADDRFLSTLRLPRSNQ